MNDCFLNLLFSFQLLLPLKDGADFVGSKQTIDVILSDLSLLGYVIPVGGLGIAFNLIKRHNILITVWTIYLPTCLSCGRV